MNTTNGFEIISVPGVVECAPNLKIDEDSAKVQASKVSNTLNNSENSGEESTKNTKDGKLSLKRKNFTEERPLKRKKTIPMPTSYMVMESMKALKKRNGASVKAILEYMEGEYQVNAKLFKRYVTKYLTSAVEKGIVEKLSGAGNDERFKIKKVEKINKIEQNLKGNRGEKVAKVGQKSNDNKKKTKAEKIAEVEQKPNQKKVKGEKVAKVE